MATTIKDIAAYAGVSVATVSRVINGTKPVNDDVRKTVEAAISKLDYTPSRIAQNLRSSRTHTIAFIVASIDNPFFPELIAHVTQAVAASGYGVQVSVTDSPLSLVVDLHKRKAVDGVIVVGGHSDSAAQRFIQSHNIPIVAIDRTFDELSIPSFMANNEQGAFECTAHLLNQAPHARHVLHIQGSPSFRLSRDRQAGFRRALGDRQISVHEEQGDFTPESGSVAMDAFLNDDDVQRATSAKPDDEVANQDASAAKLLVFADNDMMAIGAMAVATRRGYVVGSDILISGFDGINLARWVTPSLTTYNQPTETIAQAAVTKLLALIDRSTDEGREENCEFEGELVIRQSSGGRHA